MSALKILNTEPQTSALPSNALEKPTEEPFAEQNAAKKEVLSDYTLFFEELPPGLDKQVCVKQEAAWAQFLIRSTVLKCMELLQAEKRCEPFGKTPVDCEANFALQRAHEAIAANFEEVLKSSASSQSKALSLVPKSSA